MTLLKDLALLTDFYELTMANSYFNLGRGEEIAYFDYYFRKIPDQGGYAIFAGLEQLVEYIQNKLLINKLSFKSKNIFQKVLVI